MTILTKLKQTAEKATKGKWAQSSVCKSVIESASEEVNVCDAFTKEDAAHIALNNPETTLKLVEALELYREAACIPDSIGTALIKKADAILASIEKEAA